jgi:hypothetical protein
MLKDLSSHGYFLLQDIVKMSKASSLQDDDVDFLYKKMIVLYHRLPNEKEEIAYPIEVWRLIVEEGLSILPARMKALTRILDEKA